MQKKKMVDEFMKYIDHRWMFDGFYTFEKVVYSEKWSMMHLEVMVQKYSLISVPPHWTLTFVESRPEGTLFTFFRQL